jgi:hypothetical protein
MRIQELLEGKFFNDLDFVKPNENGREIDYDITEDMAYFMNHDDHAYRRHTHPAIMHCVDNMKRHVKPKADVFEPAIKECYKMYIKQFPIRELPNDLDEETIKQICDKMHEEVLQHIGDGKYKD